MYQTFDSIFSEFQISYFSESYNQILFSYVPSEAMDSREVLQASQSLSQMIFENSFMFESDEQIRDRYCITNDNYIVTRILKNSVPVTAAQSRRSSIDNIQASQQDSQGSTPRQMLQHNPQYFLERAGFIVVTAVFTKNVPQFCFDVVCGFVQSIGDIVLKSAHKFHHFIIQNIVSEQLKQLREDINKTLKQHFQVTISAQFPVFKYYSDNMFTKNEGETKTIDMQVSSIPFLSGIEASNYEHIPVRVYNKQSIDFMKMSQPSRMKEQIIPKYFDVEIQQQIEEADHSGTIWNIKDFNKLLHDSWFQKYTSQKIHNDKLVYREQTFTQREIKAAMKCLSDQTLLQTIIAKFMVSNYHAVIFGPALLVNILVRSLGMLLPTNLQNKIIFASTEPDKCDSNCFDNIFSSTEHYYQKCENCQAMTHRLHAVKNAVVQGINSNTLDLTDILISAENNPVIIDMIRNEVTLTNFMNTERNYSRKLHQMLVQRRYTDFSMLQKQFQIQSCLQQQIQLKQNCTLKFNQLQLLSQNLMKNALFQNEIVASFGYQPDYQYGITSLFQKHVTDMQTKLVKFREPTQESNLYQIQIFKQNKQKFSDDQILFEQFKNMELIQQDELIVKFYSKRIIQNNIKLMSVNQYGSMDYFDIEAAPQFL
ncbi:Conserved_hypothetical protein [Hexamita inflata]|uniref:Uncharacterized protein n=1 Tax=Hexamita inflata TaxID=28002 RepID=A0AA86P628_9EUKA|nr:Conserved hypothetical protein [Hexamita inflata]